MKTLALLMVVVAAMPTKAQTERKLTVDELFQLIESNSKTLQVRKTSVEFAQKGIEAALAGRLPDVGAGASVSYNGDVLVSDRDFSHMEGYGSPHLGTGFQLEARQVVYAGGAVTAGIRLAQLGKQEAEAGVRLTRGQQRLLAVAQYLDLQKLAHRAQVIEENMRLTEQLMTHIRAKHEQGMALQNDVTRYELQMESLRLTLRKVNDQRAVLNYQLCNQLGLEATTIVPTEAGPDGGLVRAQLPGTEASPVAEQARLGTQVAEQQLRLARSEMLPKVALFVADQLNGPYIYDLPPKDINVNNWYAGIGISYSLSSLFKQNKKVAQARLASRQALEQQDAVQESIDNEMQEAWTLYNQSFVELETQQKSVTLARQNYDVVSERYLQGLALLTDMLDASNTRLNAELQEVDARLQIVYAYYKMKFIAGTL